MRKKEAGDEATPEPDMPTSITQETLIRASVPEDEEDTPGDEEDAPGDEEDTPGDKEDTPGDKEDMPGNGTGIATESTQPASPMASPSAELSVAERESLLALLDTPLFAFNPGNPSMSVDETAAWNASYNPATSDPSSWMFPNPDLLPLPPHQFLWPPASTPELLAVASLPQAAAIISPMSCPSASPIAALGMTRPGTCGPSPPEQPTVPTFPSLASPVSEQSTTQVTTASPSDQAPPRALTTVLPATEAVISTKNMGNKRKAEGINSRMAVKTTAATLMPIPPATKKAKKNENSGGPATAPMPTLPAINKSKKTKEGKGEVSSDNLRRSTRQPKAAPPMAPVCVTDPNAPTPGK